MKFGYDGDGMEERERGEGIRSCTDEFGRRNFCVTLKGST